MRRVFTILFMLLVTVQFVQVVQHTSPDTYAIVLDEEPKEQVAQDENSEASEQVLLSFPATYRGHSTPTLLSLLPMNRLSCPYLAQPTPPPNASC